MQLRLFMIFTLLLAIPTAAIQGDFNADNKVNIQDLKQIVNLIQDGQYQEKMDLNLDKHIDIFDLLLTVKLFDEYRENKSDLQPTTNSNQSIQLNNSLPGFKLDSIKTIATKGGRVDWSHKNNLIAYDSLGEDGYYDILLTTPNGTDTHCLTCTKHQLHTGNPAWHPSGDYIVFQSQTKQVLNPNTAKPGSGIGNNLFLITRDGTATWQLTQHTTAPFGVLHPVFSHDGSILLWAEFVEPNGDYGVWQLKLADFSMQNSVPTLTNIRSFQPGSNPRFMEPGGFNHDDTKIIFTANPQLQAPSGFDVYTIDLQTEQLTRITTSPLTWDEFPHYQPHTNRVFYVSNNDQLGTKLNLDLWVIDDGVHKKITSFHDSQSQEYVGQDGSGIQDYAFDVTGTKIVAYINEQFPDDSTQEQGSLQIVSLS